MSGGRPSPGKLGLEADTRLEPGPRVGTLLGPWEDITRPLEGKGLPRTRCPLSVQAPAPRQSIIHSTHRGPTHVGSEPALGDTAEDEMDEMSSYRRYQQKAAGAHLGLLPQNESAGRTAEGRRQAVGLEGGGGGRAMALAVPLGPGTSVSLCIFP